MTCETLSESLVMFEVQFEALTSGFVTVAFWVELDLEVLDTELATGAAVETVLLGGDGATLGATAVALTWTWAISCLATGTEGA